MMRNFDAFAVALIALILLAFSEIRNKPEPFRSVVRIQQAMLRNQVQVLPCPNR
jgi:hypothetical protein